jgi:NAD-dependent dihydropyrimidine dehydrogenase PreA subunit
VDVCPENCLQLIPLKQFEFSEETRKRLSATVDARVNELLHLSPEELSTGEGSVMVKDETICIRCGLCAERCPVNTITMEAFEVFEHDPNLVQIEEMVVRP